MGRRGNYIRLVFQLSFGVSGKPSRVRAVFGRHRKGYGGICLYAQKLRVADLPWKLPLKAGSFFVLTFQPRGDRIEESFLLGGLVMKINGFQKLTLLDFPGKVACIVFTPGCNFRCPFCHNASLVTHIGIPFRAIYFLCLFLCKAWKEKLLLA